jgi:hypothetical protein
MRKTFLLLAAVVVLAGCPDPNGDEGGASTPTVTLKIKNESSYELTGIKWQNKTASTGLAPASHIMLTINKGEEGSGYIFFTKKSNALACRTQEAVTISAGESGEFVFTNNTIVVDIGDTANIQTLGTITKQETSLRIKNESFTEITDVIWQNVSLANNNTYENSIKSGTSVTQSVEAGSGYIFFKRKSNPIVARTRDLVIVAEKQVLEFIFTDDTVIMETNNTGNSGTLGSLQSTVVWFDDAEGEMQPYYESRSFVGYYKDYRDLDGSSGTNYYAPKNGQKSIAVGASNTALLHLKINLTRNAKLSFWYANKYNDTDDGAIFSINGELQRTWTTDINWSKIEIDLQTGENDIIWEKKDGRYYSYYSYYYLSLDDILIYYVN